MGQTQWVEVVRRHLRGEGTQACDCPAGRVYFLLGSHTLTKASCRAGEASVARNQEKGLQLIAREEPESALLHHQALSPAHQHMTLEGTPHQLSPEMAAAWLTPGWQPVS